MIKDCISEVVQGINLTEDLMYAAFSEIMSGQATDAQVAAFITALRMKGETAGEITGAARVMREKAVKIKIDGSGVDLDELIDTCGTGGSKVNTFNISTTTAFILAACGVKVAKHGNRSVSSQCGSADVLEKLGVNINIAPRKAEECINKIGIGFLFAPSYHSAMKYAAHVRKDIGIRTIFNILGPLSNPASASRQILGVYDVKLVPIIAEVLKNLGAKRAMVVHGMDNTDEITITDKTLVGEVKGSKVTTYYIQPEDFGFERANVSDIRGGAAEQNAEYMYKILSGDRSPRRDVVLMNASAALVVLDKVKDFKEGVKVAAKAIDNGKAFEKLNKLKAMTNEK